MSKELAPQSEPDSEQFVDRPEAEGDYFDPADVDRKKPLGEMSPAERQAAIDLVKSEMLAKASRSTERYHWLVGR